jgi:hypothetical protein
MKTDTRIEIKELILDLLNKKKNNNITILEDRSLEVLKKIKLEIN